MANRKYTIINTVPTTFIGELGKVVNGFTVSVTLMKWNEVHQLQVNSLDNKLVADAVEKLYQQREGLDKLGEEK